MAQISQIRIPSSSVKSVPSVAKCFWPSTIDYRLSTLHWTIRSVDIAVGQTRGPGQAAGYVWPGDKPFYGTRVGPGWYQGSTRVARGRKPPFSVLRMLMLLHRCHMLARLGRAF
jgi:hypothetical protein